MSNSSANSSTANGSTGTIGFIGFGAMASRMGHNLREAGYQIMAYTPSGKGGDGTTRFLPTPRALAEAAGTVLVCVPDDESLAKSLYGPDGALAGMTKGALLVNTSSVSPEASAALAAAAGKQDVAVLDAPVSGSTPEAESGTLVVLVGGDAAVVARAQPIFDVIGKATIHAGPSGSGTKLKLVVNGIMGAGLAAVAEGVTYGLAAGLDRDMLFGALDSVAVISPHHKRKLKAARVGDFTPQFPTRLMQKDMRLLMTDAARAEAPLATMAATTQLLSLTRRTHPDDDYSALFAVLERTVANSP
ncbi:6-phosphogluconate dehydrogenase NAD-binding [Gluconacetobacter diazotrophicus PA1 5]|uniref:6-phosphogluconate dehydrogenase, NAD-binding n=2 Tax=Gluconacetobacter diazotrophicus TaxID=33996 RepID=A9HL10_GLUDA|nr:NAD(P)-dependent oxidoreductase [Gluconacetobacter diazotrophicus]ACI50181.1 6-phosphogluconate dehydrogenase NAD-binding [Gluconacetobacter diazotrophicus PA1 5]MBB2154899.1 NAD(P)-dependent oxidoreductase [Gluconacetobacter diazotrophicus]TWB08063.1 3-hydroxyisobutyrate dehydrogenase-like beta-hydroxyacid dehydrogenase [Gluconacetobacter diazotrophicus]CAP56109.1 6-phosphogluconate dehydrogenase, NAD-binding [Gluconacetobacter diazotrophicus PA1 5]